MREEDTRQRSSDGGFTMQEAWELYGILCIMIKTESYGTCWAGHE